MSVDDIEACNAQFLAPIAIGHKIRDGGYYCEECAKKVYATDHAGEKCSTPHCNRDISTGGDLPQLCNSCHCLFQLYGTWLQKFESNKSEHELEYPDQRLHSSFSVACSMCKLLKLARDRHHSKRPADPNDQEHGFQYTPLGIFITGTPYSITHVRKQGYTHRPHVSWAQIRSWIVSCDTSSGHDATELQFKTLLSMDPFFIDVDDCRIVRMSANLDIFDGSPTANGVVYAALSYVWGGSQSMLVKGNLDQMQSIGALRDPAACSQTVRDAMLICRRTGVRYLWVDALCIIQDSSPEELSWQINNMDSIYANAHFTIVAADSLTAHHGIHGVSIPRDPPESCSIFMCPKQTMDVYNASLSISSAQLLASSTKWATRAWTYQEALLSRRLLIFTQELCFLACPTGIRREDLLEEPFSAKLAGPYGDSERLHFLRKDSPDCQQPTMLYDVITEFSARDLTMADDIMKAFGGIATAVKEQYGEMRYGIPLQDINFALSWRYHKLDSAPTASSRRDFVGKIVQHPSGQRDGFPSWSWAGWLHDGTKVVFPGRKLSSKAPIYYINNFGDLEVVNSVSNTDRCTKEESTGRRGAVSESYQTAMAEDDSEPGQPDEAQLAIQSCQPGDDYSSCASDSLSYILTEAERQDVWYTLAKLDQSLDSILILKTHVLRISVVTTPAEIHGEWGFYVHNFDKRKRPQHYNDNPIYDPYRSVIHVNRAWMDFTGGKIEIAVLGADTSDSEILHLEAIVLDRSGALCYRITAVDLRFKVAEGESTEETLVRVAEENPLEIIILG